MWKASRYNLVFLGALGVVFVLVRAVDRRGVHLRAGCRARGDRWRCASSALGFPLFAFGMVITQSFNGAGDTWTPTWINVFVFWAFEIPLAWLLSTQTSLGYRGGFVAITAAVLCAGAGQRLGVSAGQMEGESGLSGRLPGLPAAV